MKYILVLVYSTKNFHEPIAHYSKQPVGFSRYATVNKHYINYFILTLWSWQNISDYFTKIYRLISENFQELFIRISIGCDHFLNTEKLFRAYPIKHILFQTIVGYNFKSL